MAGAALSVDNAPRDVAQLMKFGRYSLRKLAYEMNLLSPEKPDEVTAFDRKPMEERAKAVLEVLEQIDKKAGGGAKKATKKREPAKKREPVKAKTKEEAAPEEPPPQKAGQEGAAVVDLSPLMAKLQEVSNRLEELDSKIDDVRDVLGETKMATLTNIGVNGIVGEQILQGATIEDIIKDGVQIGLEAPIPEEPEEEDAEGN